MPDYGACRFYDKAERDRHHALRRIQRRRAGSIASWAMLPWLIAAAVLLVFFCVRQLNDTSSLDGNNRAGSIRDGTSRGDSSGNDCSRSTSI